MFVTALFVQALVATAALAIPTSKERLEQRVATRNGGVRQSLPRQTNTTHVEYSSNWAGAVYNSARVSATVSASLIWIAWLTDVMTGHVQVRDGDVHGADAEGAVGPVWRALGVGVGRHRR